VVVKQVSVTGSGGGLPAAIADVAGLSRLLGQLPPGASARGVTLPVRGLTPPAAGLSRRLTGLFTVVLAWILISAYGSQIAMGVGEEKSNRIVEVILASVRPIQLLVGKVAGIGILPVQIPLIIAYALSYTVIYANGANAFYHVLGFLPPTAPVASRCCTRPATCPPGRRRSPPPWSRWAPSGWRVPRRPSTGGPSCARAPASGCARCWPATPAAEAVIASVASGAGHRGK
jgi:ABC-2 family transporter protein